MIWKNSKTSQCGTIVYFDCLLVKEHSSFEKGHTRFQKGHCKNWWFKKFKNHTKWDHCLFWLFVSKGHSSFEKDLKKTIVKIKDLKKFKNLQKWEVFWWQGSEREDVTAYRKDGKNSQSGKEVTQSGRSIWKVHCIFWLFGGKRA